MKEVKVEYVNLDEKLQTDKFDELIRKQELRELAMRAPYNKYIQEAEDLGKQVEIWEEERLEELSRQAERCEAERWDELARQEGRLRQEMLDDMVPRKGITVKLFPNTHKKLKVMAISKDTSVERLTTSIVESVIYDFDIVKHVVEGFEVEDPILIYNEEQMNDFYKTVYDTGVSKKLIKEPRKRINVRVDYPTHRKLGVMASVQDRTLDNIVSEILEKETGETIENEKIKEEIKRNNKNK